MFSANGAANGVPSPTQVLFEGDFSVAKTFQWTCPPNCYSVCAAVIAPGGNFAGPGAGGGGALSWENNIPVIPGTVYTAYIPAPSATGTEYAYFISTSVCAAQQGRARFGGLRGAGSGGGHGGDGGEYGTAYCGGGGAGGYAGNGGYGGDGTSGNNSGSSGAGGAAAGGASGISNGAFSGGGVGIKGQGASGTTNAAGGSGGTSGGTSGAGTSAGKYGGGAAENASTRIGNIGAVRLMLGPNRAYPSTNTGDL